MGPQPSVGLWSYRSRSQITIVTLLTLTSRNEGSKTRVIDVTLESRVFGFVWPRLEHNKIKRSRSYGARILQAPLLNLDPICDYRLIVQSLCKLYRQLRISILDVDAPHPFNFSSLILLLIFFSKQCEEDRG